MNRILFVIKALDPQFEEKHPRVAAGDPSGGGGTFAKKPVSMHTLNMDGMRYMHMTKEAIEANEDSKITSPLYSAEREDLRQKIISLMPQSVIDEQELIIQRSSKLGEIVEQYQKSFAELKSALSNSMIDGGLKKPIEDSVVGFTPEDNPENAVTSANKLRQQWEGKNVPAHVEEAIRKSSTLNRDISKLILELANIMDEREDTQRADTQKAIEMIGQYVGNERTQFLHVNHDPKNDAEVSLLNAVNPWVEKLLKHVITEKVVLDITHGDEGSGYQDGVIYIRQRENDAIKPIVFMHELGHHIENSSDFAKRLSQEFLRRRGTRAAPGMLVKDKFSIPYTGVWYGWGDTEVISVGLEMLVRDPIYFAKYDPEHFYLMMRLLEGR